MVEIESHMLRNILKILIPFVLIPVAAVAGTLVFDEKKHIFVSLFVAILAIVLFIAAFEKKEIKIVIDEADGDFSETEEIAKMICSEHKNIFYIRR